MDSSLIPPDTDSVDCNRFIRDLPWYLGGGLGDAERGAMTAHIASCAVCRRELEETVVLRREVRQALSAEEGVCPTARATTFQRIAAQGPDRAGRRYAVPRWLAAAASVVLIVQAGLLVWTTRTVPPPAVIHTRSVPAAVAMLDLRFQPSASHDAIVATLRSIHARVIDGPDREGAFRVEIRGMDPEALPVLLESLRANPAIERATPVRPDVP
jgi:anti-sigma factor RsiW